jgi:hypothetical protein
MKRKTNNKITVWIMLERFPKVSWQEMRLLRLVSKMTYYQNATQVLKKC